LNLRIFLFVLLCLFGAYPISCAAPPAIWDMAKLCESPSVIACSSPAPAGVKALYYAGPDYRGQPTWVFAYYAAPAGKPPAGGWPGVVLVHGGLGTAYVDWVRQWNKAGFAAISMDLEGREPDAGNSNQRHPTPHPGPTLGTSGPTATEQFPFFAVTEVIEANSLLRSMPDVNPAKVGICGISWGSIWTCLASSVDSRFAFAIPIYGHGFLNESDAACHIMSSWDPAQFLASAKCPMLFIASTNDSNFSPPPWQKTIDLVGARAEQLMLPRLVHSQEGGADVPESYSFARSIVDKETTPAPVSTEYLSTTDSGPFGFRIWRASPAGVSGGVVQPGHPEDADRVTASYLLTTRSDGSRRSTRISFNKSAEMPLAPPAFPTPTEAVTLITHESGHGNILTLAYPYGESKMNLPDTSACDAVFIRFSLKSTPASGGNSLATQKLLIFVIDATGKSCCLAWHDGTGLWGVCVDGAYSQKPLPNALGEWTNVELILDQKNKKVTFTLTNGSAKATLYSCVPYTDPGAGPAARISFSRNGQGDPGLCSIEGVEVVGARRSL